MKIVDTHQHLWNFKLFPYTWCRDFPVLNRSFLFEDYLAAASDCSIEKTVFVECDVDDPHQLDEARSIQKLSELAPLISGIVASGRPEHEGFEMHLEALLELPKVKGVRRVLHTVPDEVSQSKHFVSNVRRLAPARLTFDLCVLARQLPLALALVRQCPEVTFVLDHSGVPNIKARVFDPWRVHVAELATHPNVNCKISGLVAYTGSERWTPAELAPWVAHVTEHFGWDRIMWGSDWPVCTLASTLPRWLSAAQSLVATATEEQRLKFFQRNAERVYRLI